MARSWGRLYAGTRNHRKIKLLREEFPNDWRSWYVLLDLAIECDDGGWVYIAPDVPFSYKQLAKELGIKRADVCERFLKYLEDPLKLITISNRSDSEVNQNSSKSESEVDQKSPKGILLNSFQERNFDSDISTPRVQKYREKRKTEALQETPGERFNNVTETHQNRTDTDHINNTPPTPPEGGGDVGNGKEGSAKKNRKTKAERQLPPYSQEFEKFYEVYPNKKGGKEEAWAIWQRRLKNGKLPPFNYLMECLYKLTTDPDWMKEDGKFVPMITTFLNKGRWTDVDGLKSAKRPARKPADPNCPFCKGKGLESVEKDGVKGSAICRCRKLDDG